MDCQPPPRFFDHLLFLLFSVLSRGGLRERGGEERRVDGPETVMGLSALSRAVMQDGVTEV